jgi:hypothetical protein
LPSSIKTNRNFHEAKILFCITITTLS